MTTQISYEEQFHVYNSYFREYMTARLYRNVFNLICFVQVILASTFMTEVSNSWFAGLILTLLTSYIFVYKPGEIADAARKQSQKYEAVIHCMHSYDPSELAQKLSEIQLTDSSVPESLLNPARIKAGIALNNLNDECRAEIKKLYIRERVCTFFSGCILK